MSIALVLILLVVAIVLFAREQFSVDVITLALLVCLIAAGILTPAEAFAGLSSEVVVIIASIFVLCAAVQETGVLNLLVGKLVRLSGRSAWRLSLMLTSGTGFVSAFINNTTATALMIPPAVAAARRCKVAPARVLMPLAFASILGGTCTLVGTSANVAVSGYLTKAGFPPLGLFEFTAVGLAMLGTGLVYMNVFAGWLLPRQPAADLAANDSIREYLSEVVVAAGSNQADRELQDTVLAGLDLTVLELRRENRRIFPKEHTKLRAGDILLVKGSRDELKKIIEASGLELRADVEVAPPELEGEEVKLVELLITPQSDLHGRTLRESRFYERREVPVLAVHRHDRLLRERLSDLPLRVGDVLLVRGTTEQLGRLRQTAGFSVLGEFEAKRQLSAKGRWTLLIFLVSLLLGAFDLLPLSAAFLAGALGVILIGALRMDQVYGAINWRLLILIGGMTAFGTAMDKTGAAAFLAKGIVTLCQPMGTSGVLAGFCVLTVFLSQPMSNAAAALVVLPVALQASAQLGGDPCIFAVCVMLSASVSLVTPFEPSCLLVYGPGGYKFRDFLRFGAPLTLALIVLIVWLTPLVVGRP